VGDIDGQAERVVRLLEDRELRKRMGDAGRRTALERFSTDAIVPQYEALYEDVVRRARG
jgi:glycosyltransferase involved in cell wall biosynthesis